VTTPTVHWTPDRRIPTWSISCAAPTIETRSADLPRIDAPVLIVHGTEDRILPSESVSQRLPALAKDARPLPAGSGPHTIA